MSRLILTLNAGSSSLKFAAFAEQEASLERLAAGQVEGLGASASFHVTSVSGESQRTTLASGQGPADHDAAVQAILHWLNDAHYGREIVAVGHRVVHGGPDYSEPVLIDDAVMEKLTRLTPLAPLHQPHNLAGVKAARAAFPGIAQVACFDTAFHRSHPFVADTFALPRQYYDEGVRRYGFHGLSYEFIVRRLALVAPNAWAGRAIVAHLGNGASICAIRAGRSIASTMGLTALDGLAMGTRCGQLDPGVVLYLLAEKGMSASAISHLLYENSGLKGMSGLSQDMRELEASDSPAARDAIAYFVSRVRREIGALAADLEGADAIVFTGGIGENAWRVREAVLTGMNWLGVRLDVVANRSNAPRISTEDSPTAVYVIPTDEERMIAEHARATADPGAPAAPRVFALA
jgi:acetate kinase